jgi:hypothetical protein
VNAVDIFETRTLSYTDDDGATREVALTVTMPYEEGEEWKCKAIFDPRIYRWDPDIGGVDFLGAFEHALRIATIFFRTTELYGRIQWRGLLDCGLPEYTKGRIPWGSLEIHSPEHSPRDMEVLATRKLGCSDESGNRTALLLTVSIPFKEGDVWKCGVTFGPPLNTGVYYGAGDDRIEALLDALALARAVYEKKVPEGWASDDLFDCLGFPYKTGRSFRYELSSDEPDTPDRSSG